MELLIWAGGRWRRVCPTSGRVAGWRRRARLACSRGGALRELPPLSTLASVQKGPVLPRIRKRKAKPALKLHVNTGSAFKSLQRDSAVQVTAHKDACVQTDTESVQTVVVSTVHKITQVKPQDSTEEKENQGRKCIAQRNFRSVSTEILELRTNDVKSTEVCENRKKDDEVDSIETDKTSQKSESSSEDHLKELIIDEQDVLIIRNYIETHDTGIDLYKFDVDDNYKTLVFYKINPLVRIERCARIAQMVKERDANFIVHFARQLGLRSVTDSDEADVDKKKKKHRAAKEAAIMSIDRGNTAEMVRKNKVSKNAAMADIDEASKNKHKKVRNASKLTENEKLDEGTSTQTKSKAKKVADVNTNSITEQETNKNDAEEVIKDVNTKGMALQNAKAHANDNKDTQKTARKRNRIESSVSTNDGEEPIKSNNNKKSKESTVMSSDNDEEQTSKLSKNDDQLRKDTKITKVTDRENEKQNRVENSKDENGRENSNGSGQERDKKRSNLAKRRFIIPKRSSVRPGREYSSLEDQAIVAWISASTARERAVNGNRIWKELEGGYTKLTGQTRSWHSIRNRYLRYILPGLGALAIPPAQAQRLRAHAALGELKASKSRDNSAFKLPAVQSASARAQKPRGHSPAPGTVSSSSDSDSSEPGKHRSLRDNTGDPKPKTGTKRTPSKSQQRSKSTSPKKKIKSPKKSSQHASGSRTNRVQASKKSTSHTLSPSKARQSQSPNSSPTYSELTRRFALRNRSTPQTSPIPPATHHKRRLYNPQRLTNGSPAS